MGRYLRADVLLAVVVWVLSFVVFRSAPVQQLHDSKYTMLLAENLLQHGDLDLARYDLPADDYHLQTVDVHRYTFFPVGSAVLSAPFVAVMHLRGLSAVTADGSYDERGELAIDARLAAALMAAFALLVFVTARVLLEVRSSLAIALMASFGTQVLSTASRSVWSDTWGILLVGLGGLLLLHAAARRAPPRAILLASVLSLAYLVRPTNAPAILGVGVYLLVTDRRAFGRFALVVILVAGVFAAHSWHLFHALLPPYFTASRLEYRTPFVAIVGNLVSPSRGLLVYVPAVLALAAGLVRYRARVRCRGLVGLAGFVIVAHFVVLAGFWDWWGGHSYGPRLTTSLVPWLVLLAILAVDAVREASAEGFRPSAIFMVIVGGLCAISVAMNVVGAWSLEADRWNVTPDNINVDTARLWSWRRPQFLAPSR